MNATHTVLIVDDDPDVHVLLRGILQRRRFTDLRLEGAADGQAGLERLRQGGVDLVLSDVNMPRLTGPELIAALAAEGIMVPVILVGSLMRPEDAHGAMGTLDKQILLTDPASLRPWLDRLPSRA